MQKKLFKVAGLYAVLLSAWMQADAAGLGRLTVQSALGQPLKAEIELYSVSKDELPSVSAKLASTDAFRQARIERLEALSGLRFSVDQRQNGQPIVRISSSAPIADPFLDLLIELNWASGRLLREYTLLLDPPVESKPAAQQEPPAQPAPPIMAAPAEPKPAESKPAKPAEPAKKPAKEEAKAEKPMAKEYGPVQKGETLRAIAIKLRTPGASTDQMMVGLFQANKEAFFNDNMNLMKKGEVLKVPDFESLMLMASPSQARKIVHEQAAAWRAAHDKSAEAAASKDKAAASGKVEAAKPEAKPEAAAPKKDVLKLSKGEPVAGAMSAERQRAMEEDLAAKSRALKEAQDRIAHLEKTVKDLQRLAELKGEQKPVAPEAKPTTPAVPVEAAKPEPKPEAKPAPAPAPVPEPSLVDEIMGNPLYLGGGLAGVLLLALVGIKLARSRKEKAEPISVGGLAGSLFEADESAAVAAVGATTAAAAGAAATPAHQDSGVLTDFSRLGLGAIDTQEIDPIAEAEVYLAYGKEAQAEEILRDALAKSPDREDVLLKLLEIYHGRKDIATFEASARNLQTAVGGDTSNASWIKAAEMGRDIDPNNPLYAMAEVAADMAAMEMESTETAAVPEPISELDIEIPEMESLEMPSESEPVAEAAPEAPASVLPMGLDFEFSMEMPGEETPAAEPEPQALNEEMPSLDFPSEMATTPEMPEASGMEASLELPEAGGEAVDELGLPPLDLPEPAPEAMLEAAEAEAASELPDLDFGGMEEESAAPAAEAPASAEEAALPDLDFGGLDLELGAPAAEAEAAQEVQAAAEEEELPDLDIGALDFAAEEPEQESVAAEAAGPADLGMELSDLEMTMEQAQDAMSDEAIDIQAPMSESEELSAEVNTKLDLARAYIEMGDKEGAREILEEVLKEGSGQQIEDAQKLMAEAS